MAIDAKVSDIPGMSRGTYLKLSGDFDVEAVRNFEGFWRGQIDRDGRRFFVIDLSAITACAHEATRSLRAFMDAASEKSGGITLINPSAAVVSAMRQTNLGSLFAIFLEYRKAFEYLRNLKDRERTAVSRDSVSPDQTTRLPGTVGNTTKVPGAMQPPPEAKTRALADLAKDGSPGGRIVDMHTAGARPSNQVDTRRHDNTRRVLPGPGHGTAAGHHASGDSLIESGHAARSTFESSGQHPQPTSDPSLAPTGRLRGYTSDGRTFRAGRSPGPRTLVAPVVIAIADGPEHRALRHALQELAEEAGVTTSYLLPLPASDRWDTLVTAMENASVFVGDVSVDMRTREPTAAASMLVGMARVFLPPERVILLNTGFQAPDLFADHSIYDVTSGRRAKATLSGFLLPFLKRAASEGAAEG